MSTSGIMTVSGNIPDSVFTVSAKIDADSQEITRILQEDQDRTVLFTDLNGAKAAGNIFSTRSKVATALNVGNDEIVSHLTCAIASPRPTNLVEKPAFKSKSIDADLMKLPIPKYFPKDGGRYITAGMVVAEYGGKKNISFHRMMIMDSKHIGIRLVPRHLFTMFNQAKKAGNELKISICVGACVEVMLASATSTDYDIDELTIASSMYEKGHGVPLPVGKCDNGLVVPAECDYVIEGKITFDEVTEGPFVDITGTYDCTRSQPVIEIEKIWSTEDPIFHLLLPGGNEHFLMMGLPREPMMLRTVRQAVPRVHGVRLTEGGCCWLHGIVSISKNKEGDGVNAIMAAFTGHPSMKQVIIVDEDIDIFDDRQVEWAMATRFQGDRIVRIPGAAGSSLDPSANGTTWKVGFDATLPVGSDLRLFKRATL